MRIQAVLFRFFQRTMVTVVLLIALLLCVGILSLFEAVGRGPYTTWHNERCEQLSVRAKLIGKPESDVFKVLGHPSSVWKYEDVPGEPTTTTYNYAPYPWVASGMFQVHCREGIVQNIEKYDD
jgi:hypothetical protein